MSKFFTVEDVQDILKRKPTYCYGVIKKLNSELESQGYLTSPGRVSANYFCERYGIDPEERL